MSLTYFGESLVAEEEGHILPFAFSDERFGKGHIVRSNPSLTIGMCLSLWSHNAQSRKMYW